MEDLNATLPSSSGWWFPPRGAQQVLSTLEQPWDGTRWLVVPPSHEFMAREEKKKS